MPLRTEHTASLPARRAQVVKHLLHCANRREGLETNTGFLAQGHVWFWALCPALHPPCCGLTAAPLGAHGSQESRLQRSINIVRYWACSCPPLSGMCRPQLAQLRSCIGDSTQILSPQAIRTGESSLSANPLTFRSSSTGSLLKHQRAAPTRSAELSTDTSVACVCRRARRQLEARA